MNIKRIIAREGLVISGILLAGVLCFAGSKVIIKCFLLPTYKVIFSNGGEYSVQLTKIDDLGTASVDDVREYATQVIKIRDNLPSYLTVVDVKLVGGKEKEFIKLRLLMERLRSFGLYLLIFAFPLYLFVRFILWAIRTLKKRDNL
jgi:hypothetical protein